MTQPTHKIASIPRWAATDHKNLSGQADVDALSDRSAFLTVAETAALLRVSEKTIRRQIACGGLPACRVGRSVRIPAKSLNALTYSEGPKV
jgi:excisionase family DNA binding protein